MVDFKEMWLAALGWFLAAVSAAVAVAAALASPPGPATLIVLVGIALVLVFAPPLRDRMEAQFRLNLHGWTRVVVCGGLSVLMMTVYSSGETHRAKLAVEAEKQEQAARLVAQREAERAATLADFEQNKASILLGLAESVKAGQFEVAFDTAAKYAAVTADPELARAKDIVESAALKSRLPAQARLPLKERLALYTRLAELEPAKLEFAATAKELRADLDWQLEVERREKAAAVARAEELERVRRQFSQWDGSHPAVEREAKASMKNPDSYEHVATRFSVSGGTIFVTTTFRGTNSFGAVVPTTATATVSATGRVLSFHAD